MEQEIELNRRTDRISLSLPIQVFGNDAHGQLFRADTRTLVVTRHGGKIVLACELEPETEVTIRYPRRNREARVRIVVRTGSYPDGHHYGVELLDAQENLWGIHFPPPNEAAEAVGRVLLECASCQAQEVACLDGLALEMFQANRHISRPCQCSAAMTVWGEVLVDAPAAVPAQPKPAAPRNLRAEGWTIEACVQTESFGKDVVLTQNPSKDTVRFMSEKRYGEGLRVDIALPYQPQGGNIFIPAEIKWTSGEPEGGYILYGAAYLRRVRKSPRYAARVKVYVGILGAGLRFTGRLVDLSMTGVLMQTKKTLEVGINVRMGIEMGVDIFRTVAVVRRIVPGVGIAFEFAQMGQRDRQLLGRLIQSLKLQQNS